MVNPLFPVCMPPVVSKLKRQEVMGKEKGGCLAAAPVFLSGNQS